MIKKCNKNRKLFLGGDLDSAKNAMGTTTGAIAEGLGAAGNPLSAAGMIGSNAMNSAELMKSGELSRGQKFALLGSNLLGGAVGGKIASGIIGNQVQDKINAQQPIITMNDNRRFAKGGRFAQLNTPQQSMGLSPMDIRTSIEDGRMLPSYQYSMNSPELSVPQQSQSLVDMNRRTDVEPGRMWPSRKDTWDATIPFPEEGLTDDLPITIPELLRQKRSYEMNQNTVRNIPGRGTHPEDLRSLSNQNARNTRLNEQAMQYDSWYDANRDKGQIDKVTGVNDYTRDLIEKDMRYNKEGELSGVGSYAGDFINAIQPYNELPIGNVLNKKAKGGFLNEINGGFKHNDQNPNNYHEGVPLTMDGAGNKDIAEEGEVTTKDYVYSDSLLIDQLTGTNLPKTSKGKTPAKQAKNLNNRVKEYSGNDKIENETSELLAKQLQEVNEDLRVTDEFNNTLKAVNKMAKGGKLSLSDKRRYLEQFGTSNFFEGGGSIGKNYYNIGAAVEGMSPEEARVYVQNLANTKDPFTALGEEGYSLGRNNIAWQQNTQDNLYGGVTPQIINDTTNPYLLNEAIGGPKDSYTDEDLQRIQRTVENDMYAKDYVVDPQNRKFGVDWLTSAAMGRNFDDKLMTPRTATLEGPNPPGLAPIPERKLPPDPPIEKRETPNLLKYASLLPTDYGAPNLDNYNPATMNAGRLDPKLIDEQTMRARIDEGYGGARGGMAGLTGGSAAAQRAAAMGLDKGYMDSVGSAFMQANQANNASIMGADQFNLQNQTGIAGQNMATLNQAGMYNNNMQNQYKKEKFNTRVHARQDLLESLSNMGLEKERRDFYAKYLDQKGFDMNKFQFLPPEEKAAVLAEAESAMKTNSNKKGGKLKFAKKLGLS